MSNAVRVGDERPGWSGVVFARTPAFYIACGGDPTLGTWRDGDEGVAGRARAALVVVAPALNGLVGFEAAGVFATGCDLLECDGRRTGLAVFVVSPAGRDAFGVEGTAVPASHGKGGVGPRGRACLPVIVFAGAGKLTVGEDGTGGCEMAYADVAEAFAVECLPGVAELFQQMRYCSVVMPQVPNQPALMVTKWLWGSETVDAGVAPTVYAILGIYGAGAADRNGELSVGAVGKAGLAEG